MNVPQGGATSAAGRAGSPLFGSRSPRPRQLDAAAKASGVAHSSLIPGATLEQLLDAADRDLYAKKWLKKHPGERT
ncbi:MAG: hypothetical protein ACXW5U_22790, partial [Thermoanaerobaculia bacterium]